MSRSIALLMLCAACSRNTEAVEYAASTTSTDSLMREVLLTCFNDVWSIHVRTPREVRGVEVVTQDNVLFMQADYATRSRSTGEALTGFVLTLPEVEDEDRRAELIQD